MDSELLGGCGLTLLSEIFSHGDYSLYRVEYQGRKLVAEISPASGMFQHRWPSVRGLLTPVSGKDLPGGKRLLLFDTGEYTFLTEQIKGIKGFSQNRALHICLQILRIVTDLQSAGMICGYLGPEMFLSSGGEILLLAGRRGVPPSPFTPPEVGRARPSDPRSDVSAIGSLLFRLIAGTDSRDDQLKTWNRLSVSVQEAVQDMVAADPVNRPSGLKVVENVIHGLLNKTEDSRETADESNPLSAAESFVKEKAEHAEPGGLKKRWYFVIPVVLILAYLVFRFSAPPETANSNSRETTPSDTVVWETEEISSPWVEESLEQISDTLSAACLLEDTAIVWISNCSGTQGVENQFRAGPASSYSFVYPLVGTTSRRTSIVLVRRDDPFTPLMSSELGAAAGLLVDSTFILKPVDITILLGTDLSYAGVNSQFFTVPEAPAGTLYVDIVNHGIQYSLEGMGAASWAAGKLDGKACTIMGTEYIVSVSDIRDADKFNEEIGIAEVLDHTLFVYHERHPAGSGFESLVRQYLQSLPGTPPVEAGTIPVPDLHVLIGSPQVN